MLWAEARLACQIQAAVCVGGAGANHAQRHLPWPATHSAEASVAEHVAIVDALEKRDVRSAVRLTEDHLDQVERNLRLDPRSPDLALILA